MRLSACVVVLHAVSETLRSSSSPFQTSTKHNVQEIETIIIKEALPTTAKTTTMMNTTTPTMNPNINLTTPTVNITTPPSLNPNTILYNILLSYYYEFHYSHYSPPQYPTIPL